MRNWGRLLARLWGRFWGRWWVRAGVVGPRTDTLVGEADLKLCLAAEGAAAQEQVPGTFALLYDFQIDASSGKAEPAGVIATPSGIAWAEIACFQ